ncbi:MAG TPA: MBL fold metallo-hydrolase [Solirubrobacteraceae bacterium]|nr:MBL fold metallo-hydrolase [Solirubrobacteraceae bacterium]
MRRITWLGHATVLIEVGGARLLTDPVLRRRVGHLRRQGPDPGEVGRLDAVLVSHLHRDHLDVPSVMRLKAPIVAPRWTAEHIAGIGINHVGAGDELEFGGVTIRAVRAIHDGRRLPVGPPVEAVGYVVDGIYFAGDTELYAEMADLRPLDVALVPIWGWGTKLGPGHMDPEQAAEAVALLRPRVAAIPIHWGTLLPIGLGRRHGHRRREPAERFVEACARVAPDVRVEVLEPGGSLKLI